MRQRVLKSATAVGLLVGLAAVSSSEPSSTDAVRAGNAAFERRDLDAAERAYATAQEKTHDPGLVAFNAAAVRVARGEFREAELNYLRTLDDREAPPERRAKALYNRGVCVLQRGGNAETFRIAIACFEGCLDLAIADVGFNADARHNLEVAKLLWAKARVKQKNPPRANDPPPEEEPPHEKPQSNGANDGTENGGTAGSTTPKPTTIGTAPPNGPEPRPTNQKAPGAGNLPVLLDSERPQPLTPEDTRALLERIQTRLANDRRANARMLSGPERTNVRDW